MNEDKSDNGVVVKLNKLSINVTPHPVTATGNCGIIIDSDFGENKKQISVKEQFGDFTKYDDIIIKFEEKNFPSNFELAINIARRYYSKKLDRIDWSQVRHYTVRNQIPNKANIKRAWDTAKNLETIKFDRDKMEITIYKKESNEIIKINNNT